MSLIASMQRLKNNKEGGNQTSRYGLTCNADTATVGILRDQKKLQLLAVRYVKDNAKCKIMGVGLALLSSNQRRSGNRTTSRLGVADLGQVAKSV
jgi:hypothetical protein